MNFNHCFFLPKHFFLLFFYPSLFVLSFFLFSFLFFFFSFHISFFFLHFFFFSYFSPVFVQSILSFCLFFLFSIFLPIFLSIFPSECLSLLSFYFLACLKAAEDVNRSIKNYGLKNALLGTLSLFLSLPDSFFFCQLVCLSVCVSVCLSVSMSVINWHLVSKSSLYCLFHFPDFSFSLVLSYCLSKCLSARLPLIGISIICQTETRPVISCFCLSACGMIHFRLVKQRQARARVLVRKTVLRS